MIRIRLVCLSLLVACLLSGCSWGDYAENKGEIILYQVAENGLGLKTTEYHLKTNTKEVVEIVDELLSTFRGVDIRDFQLKEKQLSIYFSSAYYNTKEIDEVLLRAAIVKTLCQVSGVEYVEFFVNDAPLLIDGEVVGVMSHLSFMDSIGGNGYTQEKYVTLYFSDASGKSIREVTSKLTYDMTVPLARLLVEQLLLGPEQLEGINTSDVRKTVPTGTKLNSLTIRDNVCYVDFSKEFYNMQAEINSEVVVYSIVNTLCELSDVNMVQFTIDGEQSELYGDMKGFNTPFERNLDLVTGGSKG
nr:GerMN domain-containing protein [Eubacterium sp.]